MLVNSRLILFWAYKLCYSFSVTTFSVEFRAYITVGVKFPGKLWQPPADIHQLVDMSNTLHINFNGMQKKLALGSLHFPLKETSQLYSIFRGSNRKLCSLPGLGATDRIRGASVTSYQNVVSMPSKRKSSKPVQAKDVAKSLKPCLKQANGPKCHKVVRFSSDLKLYKN